MEGGGVNRGGVHEQQKDALAVSYLQLKVSFNSKKN
jgi:hypothetical protein